MRNIATALVLSTLAFSAWTATEIREPRAIKAATTRDTPLNIALVCRELITKDMGEAGWKSFKDKAQNRFDEWAFEYNIFDKKRFLDDKLLTLAPKITSGKGDALREFCAWLAMYDHYQEQLPRYIRDIREEDKEWISNTIANFDWNTAAQQVKEKAAR